MAGAVEASEEVTDESFCVGVVLGKKPVLVPFLFVVAVVRSRDFCAAVDFMYPDCCFVLVVEDATEEAVDVAVLTGEGLKYLEASCRTLCFVGVAAVAAAVTPTSPLLLGCR